VLDVCVSPHCPPAQSQHQLDPVLRGAVGVRSRLSDHFGRRGENWLGELWKYLLGKIGRIGLHVASVLRPGLVECAVFLLHCRFLCSQSQRRLQNRCGSSSISLSYECVCIVFVMCVCFSVFLLFFFNICVPGIFPDAANYDAAVFCGHLFYCGCFQHQCSVPRIHLQLGST